MADEVYFYGTPGALGGGTTSSLEHGSPPETSDEAHFLGELAEAMAASLEDNTAARDVDDDQRPSYATIASAPPAVPLPPGPPPADAALARALIATAFAPARRPADNRPLCTFFQAGSCRYGDGCRFKHAAADPAAVEFFESEILRMIEEGRSPSDAQTTEDSSSSASASGSSKPSESDGVFEEGKDAWLAAGIASRRVLIDAAVASGLVHDDEDAETALAMAERNVSSEIACSVCLEDVTAVPGRRFGLLTSCTHAFCLDCIRQWRGRIDLPVETTRSCPVCRKVSFLVIPCDRFIADEARKAVESSKYNAAQSAIPCRHFNFGKGSCPFGSSCFYAHLNPDGSPAVVPKHTIRLDSEGNVGVGRSFKLSEFLFK